MTEILKSSLKQGITTLVLPSYREYSITLLAEHYPSIPPYLEKVIKDRNAGVLNQFIFSDSLHPAQNELPEMEKTGWPTTWLQRTQNRKGEILSIQATAVSGIETRPIFNDGRKIGIGYEDEYAGYCRLSGIYPQNPLAPREEQVRSVFELMSKVLVQEGMTFADTIRTWIFLDELLDWYDDFNLIRNAFFTQAGIFGKVVPASTGIGAANTFGTAITAGLLAIRPKNRQVTIRSVDSPLQCSALDYKSSFSRALEVGLPTHRILMISGTASIDDQGFSRYQNDPVRQIAWTLQVVEALLKSCHMSWNDAFRGIAYYTNLQYHQLFTDYCRRHGIPPFPLARSHADVCRRDLLFEIELDAVQVV